MEDDGRVAKDVSLGVSVSVPPCSKSSKLPGWPDIVLSYSSGDQVHYIEVQYVHTDNVICMRYLCVCFRNTSNYDMNHRIFNVPT